MVAVAVRVRLRPSDVRDLFLGARRDRLVNFDLGNVGMVRTRDRLVRGLLVICVHGGSLRWGRSQSRCSTPLLARSAPRFRAGRHRFSGNDIPDSDALDAAHSLDDHRVVIDAEQLA
jgi:hypothetical protein